MKTLKQKTLKQIFDDVMEEVSLGAVKPDTGKDVKTKQLLPSLMDKVSAVDIGDKPMTNSSETTKKCKPIDPCIACNLQCMICSTYQRLDAALVKEITLVLCAGGFAKVTRWSC